MYNTTDQTKFIKDGFKGLITIRHTGTCIAASGEHKQFLPAGATQDETNDSYYSIRNPTPAQIRETMRNLAK